MHVEKESLPLANLLLLTGAGASIMIAGTQDVWAITVFLAFAGLALFFVRPTVRPSVVPLVLLPLFCSLALAGFLPQELFPVPEWRRLLMELESVPLASSVSPQPWLGWFWWWLLAGSCLVFSALLSAPLQTKPLALVLHAASLFVAVYSCLAIFALQSGWKYPFHGGAAFGFLPNRNHTATLLVVGSVLSFGLMQWRLARGNKGSAAFAALCGAPSLAALLFFSTSRAGVVFLVVGLAVWAAGAARSPAMRSRILAAVAVLVVFLGALFVFGGSTVRDRMATLWRDAVSVRGGDGAKDVDFRQPVFRDTIRMIADQPLSGAGIGQFADVFPQYRRDSSRAANVLHPESDWLMVAAETGIPSALALAGLLLWFIAACWRSRAASGGMLRWTAASAVIAASLHGLIDVPWHRVSLGWFLLTIAVSCVPSSGVKARAAGFSRFLYMLCALAFMAAAGWLGYEKNNGKSPGYYRWPELSSELQKLGDEHRFEQAEETAKEAVEKFPLRQDAYYWLAGYLCMFTDTDREIEAAIKAGRAVEPILPEVPAQQAVILKPVDQDAASKAWVTAIERSALIDEREGREELPTAGGYIGRALTAFKGDGQRQLWIAKRLAGSPALSAQWVSQADDEAASSFLQSLPDHAAFLDSLAPKQRQQVLLRWISLPDAPRAAALMEEREAVSAKGEYWPLLARYYAAQKDLPRAVRRVASSCSVALEEPRDGDAGLRGEMAALIAQGNRVAARRLAKDAIASKEFDHADVSSAMAYFASQNDWESAWMAASRLATEAKIGH